MVQRLTTGRRTHKRIVRDMCSYRMNGQSHRFFFFFFFTFSLLSIDPWARFPCVHLVYSSSLPFFSLLSSFLSYFLSSPSLVCPLSSSPLFLSPSPSPSPSSSQHQPSQKRTSSTRPRSPTSSSSSYHNGFKREKVASDQLDCRRFGWIHGGLDLSPSRYHQGPHAALQERCEKRCCKFPLFVFYLCFEKLGERYCVVEEATRPWTLLKLTGWTNYGDRKRQE